MFAYVNYVLIKSNHGSMPHFVFLLKWGCNQWWTHKPGHVWKLITLPFKRKISETHSHDKELRQKFGQNAKSSHYFG